LFDAKNILQFAGLSLILIAHLAMRPPTVANRGRVPFWRFPWTCQDWFSPLGYWIQLVGWTLLVGALVRSAVRAFASV
jgi:hypothetical protein